MKKEVSIIIPVCNEESILNREVNDLIISLRKNLPDLNFDVLLVENGSQDGTKRLAENLSRECQFVKTVSLPIANYGLAIKEGVLRSEKSLAVIFNIDFWDADFIKKALEIREEWDLVVGSKNIYGAKDLRPIKRRLITKSLNLFLRILFGFKGTDTHGMKVIRRERIAPILKQCRPDKHLFDTELVLRAQYEGLLIKEVPVICEEKRPSTLNPDSFIKMFKTGLQVIKSLSAIFFSLRPGQTRQRISWFLFFCSVIFMIGFSLSNLTTKPAVWYDEGTNIELARNFAEFGKLDLITEPLAFTGQGAIIGSTGYPILAPLAVFFKIFGFGFAQARIYMLFWMITALISIFLFVKKRWGDTAAAIAILLIATFPPFYGNGRSVMGEIPGFVFFMLSLDWCLSKKKPFISGIFLGLAVISKPSVFISLIPAWIIMLIWERRNFGLKLLKTGFGAFLTFLVWAFIYFNQILAVGTWEKLKNHFINPYREEGISSWFNIKANLAGFFYTPTLIYFLLFAFLIILAAFWDKEYYKKNRMIFIVSGWYSLFVFLFFLKSLGYLRYLIAVQLLMLMILPPALKIIFSKIRRGKTKFLFAGVLASLVLFQGMYLFTRAKLFYSDKPTETIRYVEQNFPGKTIGVINIPPIAALVSPEKRFQIISSYGLRDIGRNPLSFERDKAPGIIIADISAPLEEKYKAVLADSYKLVRIIGGDIAVYLKL